MKQGLGSLRLPLAAALILAVAPLFADDAPAAPTAPFTTSVDKISAGDTAWMLASTALVLMMTIPGLALFYGGLGRSKNMLSVLMQVFVIFSLVSLLWAIYGYSLAFAGDGKFFGSLDKLFLKDKDKTLQLS